MLHGLLTIAADIFWSIKNKSDKEKPRPIHAPNAVHGRSSNRARFKCSSSSYLKCSTIKITKWKWKKQHQYWLHDDKQMWYLLYIPGISRNTNDPIKLRIITEHGNA